MKTLIICLFSMFSLINVNDYKYYVSPQIEPYVNEYFELLRDNDITVKRQNFVVMFNSKMPHPSIAGYAWGMFRDDVVIVNISPKIWIFLNKQQKRSLIFHELSHDLFNSLHTEDVYIMNPELHSRSEAYFNNTKKSDRELIKYIKDGI